jgi:predicted O-methyltransferase YrrM
MEPEFTSDWFSHNIDNFKLAKKLLVRSPEHILEIGSYEGRSTLWLLENFKPSHITCIDTWKGSDEVAHEYIKDDIAKKDILWNRFCKNVSPYASRLGIMRNTSRIALKQLGLQEKRYGLIYVDGDHHRLNCLEDLVLSFPMLELGGIVIVDDYLWGSAKEEDSNCVRGAVHMFERLYGEYIEPIFINYQAGFRKTKELL